MKRALYIGRFQPFHKAHLKVVKDILEKNDNIIIAIGSARKFRTYDDPFTVSERRSMIKRSLRKEGIKDFSIHFVPDIPDDKRWPAWVKKITGQFDIVYTGNTHTGELMKKAGNDVKYIRHYHGYSGTKVRKWILEGRDWQKLVPEGTAEVINKIKGAERIRRLVKFK